MFISHGTNRRYKFETRHSANVADNGKQIANQEQKNLAAEESTLDGATDLHEAAR
jgi:hypothetical protein